MHKKVQLPQEETRKYEYMTPPVTPFAQAVADYADLPESVPAAIQAKYDHERRRRAARVNSLYGQNIPRSALLALQEAGDRESTEGEMTAQLDAAERARQQGLQKRIFLAQSQAPQLTQTESRGYTTTLAPTIWNSLLQGAQQAAAAAAGGAAAGKAAASDERLKTNLQPISVLDKLGDYQAKTWDWRDGSGAEAGVTAQDMQDSFPEAAIGDEDGDEPMKVDYGHLGALALQGVKELNEKVDMLARRHRMARRET